MSGEDKQGEFLPLSVAAAIAYGSLVPAHKAAQDGAMLDEHLDLVAAALSSIVPIFSAINAHAPEMPTRFAKWLVQIVRGGLAIGMAREHALSVAVRQYDKRAA